MPGTVGSQGVPPFGWSEASDGTMRAVAVIGDLPTSGDKTVSHGTAGVLEYRGVKPTFRMTDQVQQGRGQYPCVALGGGDKGDEIDVLVYGEINATFRNSINTNGGGHLGAGAGIVARYNSARPDNNTYAEVTSGAKDSKTHTIFLSGSPLLI